MEFVTVLTLSQSEKATLRGNELKEENCCYYV